jgi:hypothetical protein
MRIFKPALDGGARRADSIDRIGMPQAEGP